LRLARPEARVSALRQAAGRTFEALAVRNFRLYFFGQLVSISGTWMQSLAQGWLVLNLTGSAVDLGIAVALAFVPMLVFGTWGGLVVDRHSKRMILLITQSASGLLALSLGLLTALGHPTVWDVYAMSFLLGVVNLFDNPARQTFVQEMVGRELLPNAVSLNSVLVNAGRIVGPAAAGVVIAAFGIPTCFFANAASFLALLTALLLMRPAELQPIRRVERLPGQLRAGLRYAFGNDEIRGVLLAVTIIGVFAFNFAVTIPLLVRQTFGGTAATYSLFSSAMGVGAVLGGLAIAHRSRPSARLLAALAGVFGVVIGLLALAPDTIVGALLMIPLGAASISFIATANSTLQLITAEEMRGRIMALYAIGFLGSTPIGAPLLGLLSELTNPRVAIGLGGLATVVAALLLAVAAKKAPTGPLEISAI
jgi:MFS family permease